MGSGNADGNVPTKVLASTLARQPEEEVKVVLGYEVSRAIFTGNMDAAFYWLCVAARWRRHSPSESTYSELADYMRDFMN